MIHFVHPASKYPDLKSIQRPPLESEGTSNLQGGFWSHVAPNSTTVLTRLCPEPKISTPKNNHVLKVSCGLCSQDRALEPAWVFTIQSYPNVHLLAILANQHTPQSFLELTVLSSEANLALKSKIPKVWEVQPPPGSLAPWVNVQQRPQGLMGQHLHNAKVSGLPWERNASAGRGKA